VPPGHFYSPIVLAKKFNHLNTFYDREPRLDITSPPPDVRGMLDFIVSSDVLEHVAPPVSGAIRRGGGASLAFSTEKRTGDVSIVPVAAIRYAGVEVRG